MTSETDCRTQGYVRFYHRYEPESFFTHSISCIYFLVCLLDRYLYSEVGINAQYFVISSSP